MRAEPVSGVDGGSLPGVLDALRETVQEDWQAVQALIAAQLESSVDTVSAVSRHVVQAGGKRLRPLASLLAAAACGERGERHIRLAAGIECLHTATLLHDDVVDFSERRRHQLTAGALWGNASSVLVGDFIYARAFQLLVSVGNADILATMADTTATIAEGEVMQLQCAGQVDIDEAACLEVVRRKTAALFQAATTTAATLSGAGPAQIGALSEYGLNLGMAFQLADDLMDYVGDPQRTGKNVGDDLAEGKPTVPLVYAMRQGEPADARTVRDGLSERRGERFDAVIAAVRRAGALEYTQALAERYGAAAQSALSVFGDGPAVQSLARLADFAVQRDL